METNGNGTRLQLAPDERPAPEAPANLAALGEILSRLAPALTLSIHHATIIVRDRGGNSPAVASTAPADGPSDPGVQLYFLKHTYLSPLEQQIVKALAHGGLKGGVIGRRIGAGLTKCKVLLAALVDRDVLRLGHDGYELTSPLLLQVLRDLEAEERG